MVFLGVINEPEADHQFVSSAKYFAAFRRMSRSSCKRFEVPRVLFLGICLDFHYFSTGVVFPKFGFDFSWGAVAQALVEP